MFAMAKTRTRIFVASVLLWAAALLPAWEKQESVAAKRVTVEAALGWQNSGISLKSGQYYSIKAFGSWVSGLESVFKGPEGDLSGRIDGDPLVGWIADKQPDRLTPESYNKKVIENVILLGREGYFRSYRYGFLWLAMGDWSGCKECVGRIEVIITIYD
jgi:hypothetical protein